MRHGERRNVIVTAIHDHPDDGLTSLVAKEIVRGKVVQKEYWANLTMRTQYHGRAPSEMMYHHQVDQLALTAPEPAAVAGEIVPAKAKPQAPPANKETNEWRAQQTTPDGGEFLTPDRASPRPPNRHQEGGASSSNSGLNAAAIERWNEDHGRCPKKLFQPEEHKSPSVLFLTDAEMQPACEVAFRAIKRFFLGMQYMVDHEKLCQTLIERMKEGGVEGKLIVDQAKFRSSLSGGQECARIKELSDAGCAIRIYKPKHPQHGFACLHTKVWILDGEVLLTGSVNTTEAGMAANKENLFVIRDPVVLEKSVKDFEMMWAKATPMSEAEIATDYQKSLDRPQGSSHRLRRSPSARRSMTSPELTTTSQPVQQEPTSEQPLQNGP